MRLLVPTRSANVSRSAATELKAVHPYYPPAERVGIGATPFLLPLMLQLGFGLSPVQSGPLTFVSAMGAIFMKTIAARTLKLLGFKRVLVWNALLASALLCAFGLLRPATPEIVIMAVRAG